MCQFANCNKGRHPPIGGWRPLLFFPEKFIAIILEAILSNKR
jgi:hypothetical protein